MNVIGEKAQLEELAQILGTDLPGSNKILEDATATFTLILSDSDREARGWRSERSIEVLAWVVRWTWQSMTRGPRPQEATIFQIIEGGRSAGEGWAYARQYVAKTALTTEEAQLTAKLLAVGAFPQVVAEKEL